MTRRARIRKERPLQSGRLTPFQSLMRHWSALTPFNFAHAMRLTKPLDLGRWQQAASAAIGGMGAGVGPISIATGGVDIDTHLTAELNRGFDEADLPFRFFAIDAHDGGHWLAVTIDHWWADDFSCRALLQQIYSAYESGRHLNDATLRLPTGRPRPRSWLGESIAFMKEAARYRRACRRPLRDPLDFRTQTFRTAFPEEALPKIRQFARQNDATVHDALLAAAAQAFGVRHGPPRKGRDAVALISAMDLRRFENGAARTAFGVALSQVRGRCSSAAQIVRAGGAAAGRRANAPAESRAGNGCFPTGAAGVAAVAIGALEGNVVSARRAGFRRTLECESYRQLDGTARDFGISPGRCARCRRADGSHDHHLQRPALHRYDLPDDGV